MVTMPYYLGSMTDERLATNRERLLARLAEIKEERNPRNNEEAWEIGRALDYTDQRLGTSADPGGD